MTTQNVTPIAAAAPPAKRMNLTHVKKGPIRRPVRVFLYGVEKIGKSSFAAAAPRPIFLGTEDGTSELDVERFPHEPATWTELLDGIHSARTDKHDYETLVIDTVDWAEPLCWAHVCAATGKKAIEDFGYGKGYVAALDEWRIFLAALDRVRAERGMNVILIGHAQVKLFNNPEGENYDRFTPKMHEKASGLLKEWCDDVLFANYETFLVEKGAKKLGVSSGARIIHSQRRAAFDAGNRHSLPETFPLNWDDYAAGVRAHHENKSGAEAQRQRIAQLLKELGDEVFTATVTDFVAKIGDNAAKLAEVANRVAARIGAKGGQ